MIDKEKTIFYINEFFKSDKFVSSLPEKFFTDIGGKSIKVNFTDLDKAFVVKISEDELTIESSEEDHDVEICSSITNFTLFALTKGSDSYASKIKIIGDIDTANKFNTMLANSQDIRYFLSKFIGERKFSFLNSIYTKISPKISSLVNDSESGIRDFLLYDLELIPTKNDINKFLDDVDDIKSRTESLIKKYKK